MEKSSSIKLRQCIIVFSFLVALCLDDREEYLKMCPVQLTIEMQHTVNMIKSCFSPK